MQQAAGYYLSPPRVVTYERQPVGISSLHYPSQNLPVWPSYPLPILTSISTSPFPKNSLAPPTEPPTEPFTDSSTERSIDSSTDLSTESSTYYCSLADNQWSKSMKETCRIQRKSRRLRSDRTAVRSIGPDYRSSPTHFGHRFARCAVNAAAYPVARVNQVKNRETRGKGRRVGSAGRSQTFPVLRFPISRFLVARRKLRLKFSMKRLLLHE